MTEQNGLCHIIRERGLGWPDEPEMVPLGLTREANFQTMKRSLTAGETFDSPISFFAFNAQSCPNVRLRKSGQAE